MEKCNRLTNPVTKEAKASATINGICIRLSDYEDSELLPEQIQKLGKAQADGRFAILPAKIGDKVYWFWCDSEGNPDSEIYEETILYFYFDENGIGIATDYHDGHIGHFIADGEIVNGIRRIFLSRESAEKASKG